MSHGIEKETYVNADEKTTKALTFDLLNKLYEKIDNVESCHTNHLNTCNNRFKKIENNKRKNTAIAATSGFGGGFVAVGIKFLKDWLT